MLDWLKTHVWLLVFLSIALVVLVLIIAVAVLLRLPPDHFMHRHQRSQTKQHPAVRISLLILKNVLGLLLLLIGGLLSLPLVPGPGIILVVLGLSLMNFPGKRNAELYILNSRWVSNSLNWLRARAARPPLQIPRER